MKKRVKRIRGSADRLRLSVFRSNLHIFAQLIDDERGVTLAEANSLKLKGHSKLEMAKIVGESLAEKAKEKNITLVVFDRGSYQYKGRVKSLAQSARDNGLKF